MSQLDIFSLARPSDPETSFAAARLTDRQGGMRRVLTFLAAHSERAFTDHQIAEYVGMDKGSAAVRRKDLRNLGYVEFADEFGVTPTGAKARMWRVTPAGVAAARSAA